MSERIFISHSSKDQKVAQRICAALEDRGLGCWVAYRNIGAGDNFQDSIVHAIRSAPVMVLVFSGNANNSSEIKKELALASQYKLVVIPVRVEDVAPSEALAYELAAREWINLFKDWEPEIRNLCTRIEAIVPKEASTDVFETRGSRNNLGVGQRLRLGDDATPGTMLRVLSVLMILQAIVMIVCVSYRWPSSSTVAIAYFGAELDYLNQYTIAPASWAALLLGIAILLRTPHVELFALPVCTLGIAAHGFLSFIFIAVAVQGGLSAITAFGPFVPKSATEALFRYLYPIAMLIGFFIYVLILVAFRRRYQSRVRHLMRRDVPR
jgi:hypothetical protein